MTGTAMAASVAREEAPLYFAARSSLQGRYLDNADIDVYYRTNHDNSVVL
jgi:hypothetical protein